MKFHPIGIPNETTTLRFFAPSNRGYANYSVVDLHGTAEAYAAKCERRCEVVLGLGHRQIDLLKIDIEGAWQPVLEDMIESGVRPRQLCIEFDSPTSVGKMVRMIGKLREVGYRIQWFKRENFLFYGQ